jgi:hypothetical protein
MGTESGDEETSEEDDAEIEADVLSESDIEVR